MNSTLKSLLFWMVLVVVGVLIWTFSTSLTKPETPMAFSEFLTHLKAGDVVEVTMTGNEISGTLNNTQATI